MLCRGYPLYDNLGNITQIKKDGVLINKYSYDTLGQLICEEDAVAGVMVYGVPVSASCDVNIIPDGAGGYYSGYTLNGGLGLPGVDVHVTESNTETIAAFNLWKVYSYGWEEVKSWFGD